MRPAGLRHVRGLLPAQALTQLIHLHALKLSVAEDKKEDMLVVEHIMDKLALTSPQLPTVKQGHTEC